MVTAYFVYFIGKDISHTMTAQELFPLLAHPLAFEFIDRVELSGVVSPVSETETAE